MDASPDLSLCPPVLTADAMRRADRHTIDDYGIPGFTLMESAGRAAARVMEQAYGPVGEKAVLVLCGKGNNGGDGLVVARRLVRAGARVHVALTAAPDALRDDPKRNHAILERLREEAAGDRLTISFFEDLDALDRRAARLAPDLCVDALLGTGLTSELREPIRSVVGWLNEHPAPTVALDVPTGLNSDTGAVLGDAVEADRTVTMAARKLGLCVGAGPRVAGAVTVVEIGIPDFAIERAAREAGCPRRTTDAAVRAWWPDRAHDAYKYSAGTALVVGGAPAFTGAPVMAARGAARSGAGYVTCACPEPVQPVLAAKLTAIPTRALPAGEAGGLAENADEALADALETADALLVGPGLGRAPSTQAAVRRLLRRADGPVVVDADGLNAVAGHLDALAEHAGGRWVLTPHAGEFRRLAGAGVDLTDRVAAARTHAERWNSVVLLKGAPSVVAGPDGAVVLGAPHSPALATAGTGDVLAGQCAGLLAQGVAPLKAAAAALHLGGRAAERYAARADGRTMQATDLLDELPAAARETVRHATSDT
jgi:NAD(P)H-hydrate epimerase